MLIALRTILVSAAALLLLMACGQKGPLFMPTGEAATGRATLTEALQPTTTLKPAQSPAAPASAPPTGTAAPVRTP